MADFYVTFRLDARYVAKVKAETLEEAIAKAEDEYLDADFGAAEDIDGYPTIVEDENGNYIWEK